MSRWHRRRAMWIGVVALTALALVVVLSPVEVGDSYCGTALYDTVSARPCTSAMAWRRVLGFVCALGAWSVLALLSLGGQKRGTRTARLVSALLVGVAATCALVALNRLLQPTTGEWCGSVSNRHLTGDLAIDRRCDELVSPYRRAAALFVALSVVAVGVRVSALAIEGWPDSSALTAGHAARITTVAVGPDLGVDW